jgi:hypothetical protein
MELGWGVSCNSVYGSRSASSCCLLVDAAISSVLLHVKDFMTASCIVRIFVYSRSTKANSRSRFAFGHVDLRI